MKNSFDIFHPTYYDPYFLNYLKGKPFVLTIYDMIHELFQNFSLQKIQQLKIKKDWLKQPIALLPSHKIRRMILSGISKSMKKK